MRLVKFAAATMLATLVSGSSMAAYNLKITEIWPGNEPGSNLTQDWFEVTNLGDMTWTNGVDGSLYFDDESTDPVEADLISGVASIAPGQSVVLVDDASIVDFLTIWGPVAGPITVGTYAGAGLGQGGDGVALFLDTDSNLTLSDLIDFASYPDANAFGGQSWDVRLQAFSTVGNANGAVATTTLNDANQPAIGSPGSAPVPEPSTLVLLAASAAALACRRRR